PSTGSAKRRSTRRWVSSKKSARAWHTCWVEPVPAPLRRRRHRPAPLGRAPVTLSRRDAALAFLVAAVFLLLGTVYFTGLYCSDATRYMLGAMRIALGEPSSIASLAERRVMFLLPAALFHAAGRDVELLVAPYLLFFAGTGCAGYLLARRFMSSGGALLAA